MLTRNPVVDERFAAFADATRRRILRYLCASDADAVTLDDLLSALTNGADAGSKPHVKKKLTLVHVHLPKLEQAGFVERDDETVRVAVAPRVVEEGLRLAARLDPDD